MTDLVHEFSISIDQVQEYEFRIKFDKPQFAELVTDEPPPLGRDGGPNPSRILAAAIGNCLSASLLFCARKAGVKIESLHTEVKMEIVREEAKRLRVGRVEVTIDPRLTEADQAKARACRPIFEDYCTVTQSVRQGIDVQVSVKGLEA